MANIKRKGDEIATAFTEIGEIFNRSWPFKFYPRTLLGEWNFHSGEIEERRDSLIVPENPLEQFKFMNENKKSFTLQSESRKWLILIMINEH